MGFVTLTSAHLVQLISSVFPKLPQDRIIAILVDLPLAKEQDQSSWKKRRAFAEQITKTIKLELKTLALDDVWLIAYPNVGTNNGDLPEFCYRVNGSLPSLSSELEGCSERMQTSQLFEKAHIMLAPTQFSTTAPLKNAARKYRFRAATMPGFTERMLPALQIDYTEVARRLQILKQKLDAAESAGIFFQVKEASYFFNIDLRFRTAHISAGRFTEPGQVGNLPSGETYIVPYEGENEAETQTQGDLPVQFGDEIVLYHVEKNRARAVYGKGNAAKMENSRLQSEPAYGNIAELGLGVLADFGIEPVGEVLLDEKLGLHIAFGRSDHFGGFVGAGQFSSPQALVHIDRIYIPQTQPDILVSSVKLHYKDGTVEEVIHDGKYTLFSPLS